MCENTSCKNCSDEHIKKYVDVMFEYFAKSPQGDSKALIIHGKCSRLNMAINKKRRETGLGLGMHLKSPELTRVEEEIEMSKSKALQVFTFNEKRVRVVMRGDQPWWVAKDICNVLEIQNVTQAVEQLDTDERSMFYIGRQGEANVINESGVYALIIRSNKPEAKKFRKWITSEVLPAIRQTGEYATPEARRKKTDKSDEVTWKRLEIMENNSNHRMAMAILKGIDIFKDVMTPESKTVFMAKYAELTTKHNMTHALPAATEKWYTATDLGKEFGVSAQKIGLLSNEHKLKAPEGQSNEYGTWIRSKSQYSSKEVMTWVYYEAGRAWFAEHFKQAKTA